jgi:hypothetical protein
MHRLLFFLFLFMSVGQISAQTSSSIVTWKNSIVEIEGKKHIKMEATIKNGWHLYSQFIEGDGPVPTSFTFTESKNYSLIGKVKEEKAKTTYDSNFDMEISYFEGTTVFTQEVKNNTVLRQKITGSVEFMVCDDTMCYPPEVVEITIDLP